MQIRPRWLQFLFTFDRKRSHTQESVSLFEKIKALAMEGRISALTLLSLVLSGVGAIEVNIPKELYEFARGDNVTLPCIFKPKTPSKVSLVIIKWFGEAEGIEPDETLILTYYSPNKHTDIITKYEGRMSLDADVTTGKANLKINSIRLSDNKEYKCSVSIPGDDDGKLADTAVLVVLVAPSKPICAIQGKAEYGQNINLTCLSAEGSPAPVYSWKSQDVRKAPRLPDPRTTDKGGILSLYNISKDTSGYYTCTSRNKIRSATCNLTLSVMPPSMNIGSTGGIIGGVVAVLVIIIVVICCCCYLKRKKKKKEEEYAMGAREDEYSDKQPVRNGESRIADGQEDDRGHDDSSVRRPVEGSDRYEERSERDYKTRSDYDDRQSDYDDRRNDSTDRRSDYDDRRSDYDDRRSDYDDRRDKYSDRNERYDDRRNDDRRNDDRRNDDRRDRHNDDDRYDEPYDDRDLDRPPLPANKPPKKDYRD